MIEIQFALYRQLVPNAMDFIKINNKYKRKTVSKLMRFNLVGLYSKNRNVIFDRNHLYENENNVKRAH